MADATIGECETVPELLPALADDMHLLARRACNGETMWAREHAEAALRALVEAGCTIDGIDFREYLPGGGAFEAFWESVPQGDENLTDAVAALQAGLEEYEELPWVLVTYRSSRQ